jgi:hypothetical protein
VTRKRWRIKRIMLVPAQWQGSVEHFYHYFLGYFMPTVLWQESTGSLEFTVRDCGPMNPWFSLLRPGTDLVYMPPGVMLERVMSRRQEMQVLRRWDDPNRFHRSSLERFARTILDRTGASSSGAAEAATGSSPLRITVLHRAPSPDYYLTGKAESHGSGADWRSLPNTDAIATSLADLGDVTLLDTAALSPAEQVRALAGTQLLVAQHGAGLANMVWMPPGGAVLEIKPPLVQTINEIFANLAAARGLDHLAVDQSDEHAPVDPARVRAAAERLIDARGSLVPAMPGRLPTRILRQLPRSL